MVVPLIESHTHPAGLSEDTERSRSRTRQSLSAFLTTLIVLEFVTAVGTGFVASNVYHRLALEEWVADVRYISSPICVAALILAVAAGFRNYSDLPTQSRPEFLWRGVKTVSMAFCIFLAGLFMLKLAEGYSRGALSLQFVGVAMAVAVVRNIMYSRLRTAIHEGRIAGERLLLIGAPSACREFAGRLERTGIQVVGNVSFLEGELSGDGALRTFVDKCRAMQPDQLLVLAAPADLSSVPRLADALSRLPAGVHVAFADGSGLLSMGQPASLGEVATLQVLRPPLTTFDKLVKRTFDVVTATAALLIVWPLMLVVAIAIKLDSPGPIIFRQTRHGYNNRAIRVLKFRSMTVAEDGDAFTQAARGDPRVTRIGRILRHTSIDELPQLFNVLSGEMSLVGPRPHATAHNRMFEEEISPLSRRHNVKPGITGWAQVNGLRGETDTLEKMRRRVEYDLFYIDNWSIAFDVKILLMTVFSTTARANAF